MTITRRITTAVAAAALVLNAFATPALAATTIEISGNGSSSDSTANVAVNNATTVVQTNNANVTNKVDVNADTGNNDANDNTGGDVSIDTGDVDTSVSVLNALNTNNAQVDCCAATGDTDVLISGNGSNSDNEVNLANSNSTGVFQSNNADVKNKIDVDGDTGNNDANDNTGGDVSIETGDVDTTIQVSTLANANSAVVGGGNGNEGGSLSARIVGNGSNSDNDINLALVNDLVVAQDNEADVENKIDVDGDTGKNDADDNTGGEVFIDTGDVTTDVTVDNAVNFNQAETDCGCLLDDILAKISGNGTDSNNDINASLGGAQQVYQSNCGESSQASWLTSIYEDDCEVENDVDVDSDTGKNDSEDNTGSVDGGDPAITTGDADTTVELSTTGNANVYGSDAGLDLSDFDFDFNLNLGDLLDWLMSH